MKIFKSLIGGKLLESEKKINVINPADESVAGEVFFCNENMINSALEAAKNAFEIYSKMTILEKEKLIIEFKEKILSNKKTIIDLLISETGKTIDNATYDFGMLTDCLSFFVEEVKRHYAETIPDYDNKYFNYLKYSPVGVVGAFLAWNYPLLNLGYKLGPILASGNTCVIKPSISTPLATSFIGELFNEIDFPKGTLNIIICDGKMGSIVCKSKIPRLLTVIGSTTAGEELISNSTTSIKRFSLELGGNAPVIVFKDADINEAANEIVSLKFNNAGQICVAPNRILLHESIHDEFVDKAINIAKSYKLGSGYDKGNILSPVISEEALNRILNVINDAEKNGAKVLYGGKRANRKGYFIEPTILINVRPDMDIFKKEIFGPVVAIMKFKDEEDIFNIANNTDAGLAAYIFTKNINKILEAEERILSGNILINGVHYSIQLPHGGLKQSGYGKDVSHLSLEDFFDVKRISIKR